MLRIPLYLKLMFSYVLVGTLVVLPTFLYVRVFQAREVQALLRDELRLEAENLATGLSRLPPEEVDSALRFALASSARRTTFIALDGRVLGDSVVTGKTLENHLDRPEVQAALNGPEGVGTAERASGSSGQGYLYAAARYPRTGVARGVVRLAASTATLEQANSASLDMLGRAGAVAASAAVLFSLVAAFVVSRPLRRIADGARAFAAGDFGHDLKVRSRDELGEVARALEDLAARLRERLLQVGADRVSLRALLDDLPVGVLVYGPDGELEIVNGRARAVCAMTPDTEAERAVALAALPEQAAARRQAMDESVMREAPLTLPWAARTGLRARWIPLPRPDGSRQPALAIIEDAGEGAEQVEAALRSAAEQLRAAATRADPERLEAAAAACERAFPRRPPQPHEVAPAALEALVSGAVAALAPLAAARRVEISVTLPPGAVQVVDAGARVARVVREVLRSALEEAEPGSRVALRAEVLATAVRVRGPLPAEAVLAEADRTLRALGGEASREGAGPHGESLLLLPRA